MSEYWLMCERYGKRMDREIRKQIFEISHMAHYFPTSFFHFSLSLSLYLMLFVQNLLQVYDVLLHQLNCDKCPIIGSCNDRVLRLFPNIIAFGVKDPIIKVCIYICVCVSLVCVSLILKIMWRELLLIHTCIFAPK
jgi:hypothetical protein